MKKFLLGALVGAGVALLYAPATGRATRSRIRDKATRLGNDMSDMIDSKTAHLKNKMEGVKARARSMMDQVSDIMPGSTSQNMHDPHMRDAAMAEPSI